MKIDAYNEQKRISDMFEKADKASGVKGSVSGVSLSEAVIFDRTGSEQGIFEGSSYGMGDPEGKKARSFEEVASQAAVLQDNMKAICNKMDMGELVTMDEEGVDVNDIEVERIVTVGEQIRIKLAAAGDENVYTGDLSEEDAEAVLGSGAAYLIADKLAQYNYPVTEDNAEEIAGALSEAEALEAPDVSAKAYLMKNGLEPTIENLYMAEHAGNYNSSHNAVSEEQWQSLLPQIEGMLSGAGIEADEEKLAEIRELIDSGAAITPESLGTYKSILNAQELIEGIHSKDPKTEAAFREALVDKMAAALVDRGSARSVDLSGEPADWQKAKEAMRVLDSVTQGALAGFVDGVEDGTYDMNLEGLAAAEEAAKSPQEYASAGQKENIVPNPLDTYDIPEDISELRGVRQLLELRLMMTFEAVYILQKNGIEVNTEELSRLVEELRNLETAASSVKEDSGQIAGAEGLDKLSETMQTLNGLRSAPCDVFGEAARWQQVTLEELKDRALPVQKEYEEAQKAYETMQTQIRPELGDRVSEAVAASTENILKELELDDTEENRRAVRILAYNDMEITVERLERVKEIDADMNSLFEKMTPDIALDMLREGVDIMGSELAGLNAEVVRRREEKDVLVTQKFSEYLYGLDKKGEITGEDREKYMALYSVVTKLTKDKGNAAGQLVNQGNDATLGNLVTAYMTRNGAGLDVSVSEEGPSDGGRGREHNNAKLTYYKELLSRLGEMPEEAVALVTDNGLSHTVNNLSAAGALYEDNACVYKDMRKADVEASLDRFLQAMDEKDGLLECYSELNEQIRELINNSSGQEQIGLLRRLGNGMALLGSMSKHNTFYIPYDKENGVSAIRLSVTENTEEAGSFTVDMESGAYGHVQVSAKAEGDNFTAYVLAEAAAPMEEVLSRITELLKDKGFSSVKLSLGETKEFPKFHGGRSGRIETKKLFTAAKVFVENFR